MAASQRPLALALLLVAFFALCAQPALAGQTHVAKTSFGAFAKPSGITVDQTNGNVFVADGEPSNWVEILGPEGAVPSGVTATKIEGFAFNEAPSGLAIDNSPTSPSKGALYVADVKHNAVKKFVLEGAKYKEVGTLNPTPPAPSLVEPLGAAVDAVGNVFVSDGNFPDRSIVEFSSSGAEIVRIETNNTVGIPSALAFDSAGNLFAQSFGGKGVWELEANASGEIELSTQPIQITKGSPTGIAIDPTTDTLYVAEKTHVDQYATDCTPVNGQCAPELQFGFGTLDETQRLAVAPNGDIDVVDRAKGKVVVFAAALAITPEPETKAASQVKQAAVTLNGAVSAAAGPPASCEFQYTGEADFKAKGFQGAASAPCSPAGPFTGAAEEAVKAEVAGLDPETTYRFRLIASNENGPAFGETLSFATVGKPKIDATAVGNVTLTAATLQGLINPNGGPGAAIPTTYYFEYATSASYADAVQVPLGGKAIGSGSKDVKVEEEISGLSPGATYHFRIVAENEAGQEIGPDRVFTTYPEAPIGLLPDNRAYEQVTPVDKNGGEPRGNVGVVQASPSGDGVVYFSHGGIPGSEGAQSDPVYLSTRGAEDWSTQGLLPPASRGAVAAMRGWSEDLRQAYVSQSPLPGISTPASMLERDNSTRALRTIAAGAQTPESFRYVGASTGGAVVAFESDTVLTPPGGAPNAPNVYAWDKASGEVLLAGVFNNGKKPLGGALAGSNQLNSRRESYLQAQHTLAEDGSALYFRDAGTGQLYVRRNPAREQSTVQAGKCTESELACTLQLSASQRTQAPLKDEKPATFWTATPEGSKAFFTSPAKLTDNATTGPGDEGDDLYRYDAETGTLTDLTPDALDAKGAEVRGVLGASDDGSKVYFVANGVLADGAAPGDCTQATSENTGTGQCNLYLSAEGTTRFIAPLSETAPDNGYPDSANWVSEPRRGGTGVEKTSRLSADGQILLFRSQEQLSAYDNEGTPELYRYDAAAEEIGCVSCDPSGTAPVGPAQLRSSGTFRGGEGANTLTRNLSADGRRVFFETNDKLVAADTNGEGGCLPSTYGGVVRDCQDVYEWEAKGAGTCESEAQDGGCLYLISTGANSEPAFFIDADREGDNAFFFTSQQLVGQDQDQIVDIYDARVGGGIAAQNPPAPVPPCEGDACKGLGTLAPGAQSAGSASFAGPPNPSPSRHHKKKRHKHKKAKKHQKRHAARRQG